MKRIFSFIAACATMFALAACQEELQQPVEEQKPVLECIEGELQEVTFSVNLEDKAQTKAISDGLSADRLEYAVYYADDRGLSSNYQVGDYIEVLSTGKNAKIEKSGERTWKVTLTLAKNVKYDIVFWADNSKSPYVFDEENAQIIVSDNYTGAANAENRDAFYGLCKGYSVISSDERVELRRPFAQINFGACDYIPYVTDLGLVVTSTIDTKAHEAVDAVYDSNGRLLYPERPAVAKCTVPNILNVLDGSVSGEAVVNYQLADIPFKGGDEVLLTAKTAEGENIPYHWMGMNYILAGPEATINNIHATFHYNGQDLVFDVPNVPYKRNFKTNIIGNLFTENAKFNVVVVPEYENEIIIKDGQAYAMPEINGNEYIVKTSTELAWIADQVNSGLNDFAGKTVSIASDINLSNYNWTPIGTDANPFKGTIQSLEAQTKSAVAAFSISGLKVNHTEGPAGLVGVLNGGAVKNITLVEPDVKGAEYVGTVVGKIFTDGLVEVVTVTGGQVNGNHFVGGLVGHAYGSVKKSVVDGTVVTGTPVKDNEDLDGDKVGGVIGYHAPDADGVVSENEVRDVTVFAKRDAGAVAGAANAANVKDNHVEKATIGSKEAPIADNAGIIVGRVLAGLWNPEANTYNHENITVNGVQAEQAVKNAFSVEFPEATIPVEGREVTVKVTANVPWTVAVPEGVTAEPASGNGNAEVKLTFPKNTLTEQVSYKVTVSTEAAVETKVFELAYVQAAAKPAGPVVATVAEFLSAEVGDTEYQLTGVIEDTYNTQYGNFYLNDGTAKVLVYGLTATKVESNDKSFASLGLRDGDTVTLIGTRAVHNDKPQVGGPAYYVSHVAAPYLDLPTPATIESEATEYKITVESNTAWTATASEGVTLDVNSGEGNGEVTMTVPANTANEAVTYTVTFTYGEKTATFTLTQKGVPAPGEPVIIFKETFAKCTGTMGWSGSVANGTFAADNENWTVANAYGANGVAKFGAGSKLGIAETPALNITGTATLKFKAGAWSGDATTLKLSMTNGTLSATSVTMKSGDWTEYEITITNATEGAKIKFEGKQASKARFFLDDIVITQ